MPLHIYLVPGCWASGVPPLPHLQNSRLSNSGLRLRIWISGNLELWAYTTRFRNFPVSQNSRIPEFQISSCRPGISFPRRPRYVCPSSSRTSGSAIPIAFPPRCGRSPQKKTGKLEFWNSESSNFGCVFFYVETARFPGGAHTQSSETRKSRVVGREERPECRDMHSRRGELRSR